MPLADEALRVDRPDQAAVIAGASVDLLDRVPDAGLGLRTQALSAPAQVLERLVATPAARRATADAIEQVYRAAALAAASRSGRAFDDACAALLPMAGAEPGPLLVRGGVVSVGTADDPDRPVERLVARLGDLGDLAWPRRGEPLTNPRVWVETCDALARRLWVFIRTRGGQAETETLLSGLLGSMLRVGITTAGAGDGESAWLTYDTAVDIAKLTGSDISFAPMRHAILTGLAHVGLRGEASKARTGTKPLAEDVADKVRQFPPADIAWLKREVPMAGEFIDLRTEHAAFLARLR
jgi:hypothetical protein